jgi:hypothetical protein
MPLTTIFFLSGLVIALLLFAKKIEMEHKRTFILLKAISRGDERVRDLSHQLAHTYSEGKEKLFFFATKQLPMRSKTLWSKAGTQAQEIGEAYLEKIRGAKILKRGDQGISEFFKNLRDKEIREDIESGILKDSTPEAEELQVK